MVSDVFDTGQSFTVDFLLLTLWHFGMICQISGLGLIRHTSCGISINPIGLRQFPMGSGVALFLQGVAR